MIVPTAKLTSRVGFRIAQPDPARAPLPFCFLTGSSELWLLHKQFSEGSSEMVIHFVKQDEI